MDEEVHSKCSDLAPEQLAAANFWINSALEFHHIEHPRFPQWLSVHKLSPGDAGEDSVWDYHNELLDGPFGQLKEQMIDEAFFVLFLNRTVLKRLNEQAASALEENEEILARCHIPIWVRRAVFHRDRGLCSLCHRNISGLIAVDDVKHFDHIIPLARHGINDVTNIQLLCDTCNTSKGCHNAATSSTYQKWY